MALPPGAVIGGYRIERVLGSGGMGAVYLGQHPSLPRQDAIKVLNAELSSDPEFRARFEREGSLAAGLDHPNIVPVYNRGEEQGLLWIAMKFVPGTDASEEAQKGHTAMPVQRALRIIAEVGKGLDYAHRRRLLHRDVKPANFLLSNSQDDDEERVLLTDFGVAKSVEDGQDLTGTGKFMATIAYASPEQLLGRQIDHRSDIYSLGCSFFRLLVGQNPYPSTVPAMVMMGHINEPPPQISALRRDLPVALDGVFARVLAKNPADRYSSCRDFVADAESALYGQRRFQAPTGGYPSVPGNPLAPPDSHPQMATAVTQRDRASVVTWPRDGFSVAAHGPTRGGAKRRKLLIAGASALVAVLAIVAGIYAVTAGGSGSSVGPDLAQVRSEHPEFAGKTVAAFNFGNSLFSVALDGSPQANFLRDIGFRYSDSYLPLRNEKSPRDLSPTDFSLPELVDVVIVGRSDSEAGNGGLGGLPLKFLNSTAKIVVIDDIATVQAFQVWTDQSPGTLVNEMVPAISRVL
ncbi:serine/threonine-protein kinase [Nocardia flavorosea]|uniref:non-specific serine/threonine protein kinase n=1 Tax=Nocardia flavorosea TaxID=53429 RepID=A0A846YDV8_9NOCA|nr:serine/threonine-protein kinase [Nocardia flavorosea]NKY56855.1 serine/threonine protein kinase [Nocardia flavorosea]